jgi:epsilon-lactone hydrolase
MGSFIATETDPAKMTVVLEDGSLSVPARIIPIPDTISKEAKEALAMRSEFMEGRQNPAVSEILAEFEGLHTIFSEQSAALYPITSREGSVGRVDCIFVEGAGHDPDSTDTVLINVIGNAPFSGKKNLIEATPLASLLKTLVVRPLYRAPPRFSFAVAAGDIISVYKELAPKYRNIAIYGGSSGGNLTFQVIAKLFELEDIRLPDAIATWGGNADSSRDPDSFRTNHDLDAFTRNRPMVSVADWAARGVDVKDPLFSPIYSNLAQFPPALLTAGGRDWALSPMTLMHRAMRHAGAHAELMVFEAMGHGFPYFPALPEAQELYAVTADFFTRMFARARQHPRTSG